jgi:hypothetical protein
VLHFIEKLRVVKNDLFPVPPLFAAIQRMSGTPWKEMHTVFNMGHRMEFYVPEARAEAIINIAKSFRIDAKVIGHVEGRAQSGSVAYRTGRNTLLPLIHSQSLSTSDATFTMSELLTKLASLHERREEVGKQLADPAVIADRKRFVEMNRTYRELEPVDEAYERFKRLQDDLGRRGRNAALRKGCGAGGHGAHRT